MFLCEVGADLARLFLLGLNLGESPPLCYSTTMSIHSAASAMLMLNVHQWVQASYQMWKQSLGSSLRGRNLRCFLGELWGFLFLTHSFPLQHSLLCNYQLIPSRLSVFTASTQRMPTYRLFPSHNVTFSKLKLKWNHSLWKFSLSGEKFCHVSIWRVSSTQMDALSGKLILLGTELWAPFLPV